MRRTLTLIGGTALMILALLVPASAAAATTTATAQRTVFAFALVTPNTAVAPSGGMMARPGVGIEVSRDGKHGEIVALLVPHPRTTMGDVHTRIPMTVTSTRNAPPGSNDVEGVTVGGFAQPTGGTVARLAARGFEGCRWEAP